MELVYLTPEQASKVTDEFSGRILLIFSKHECEPCAELEALLVGLSSGTLLLDGCFICKVHSPSEFPAELSGAGIRHFPTLVLLDDGHVTGIQRGAVTKSGALGEARLREWLQRCGDPRAA